MKPTPSNRHREDTTMNGQPPNLSQRIIDSIKRGDLPPHDERSRLRFVMDNLVLHLHPSKVNARALKFTYTWGLGGLALLLLAVLIVTGVLLLFVYTPTPDSAYNDILALQTEVMFGQLIRNLHHWSGNALLIVAVLHLLRVFFTGAFGTPREFNWLLGLSLLLLVVAANFTGYLLPWDQLAYWAVTVGTHLLGYVPLIGDALVEFALGGPEVGEATLTNFYALHIAIVPLGLFGIASFHIWRVRKDGFSIPRHIGEESGGRQEKVTTIPHLLSIEAVFALVSMAALLAWAVWVNAPLEQAANPAHSPNPAKAAWYFMGLQELLLHFHPVFGAIVIPLLGLGALAILPYLDRDMDSEGIWFRSHTGRALAALGALVGVVVTPALVLLDEYAVNLPDLMPSLPTALSNGWIPLAGLLLVIWMYYESLRVVFRASACEARQSVFTLLLVGFVVLTVIGVWFRGEGMALMWPWEV
jgi:quinol-cytochrome oxidoreductase complex cytochrome b subunit